MSRRKGSPSADSGKHRLPGALPASTANLLLTLEPAFTAAVAWRLLGERLGAAEIAGGLVIMSGVAVLRLGERAHAGAAPEALAGEPSEGVRERAA